MEGHATEQHFNEPVSLDMLTVAEIMTRKVVSFDPETTIREAMETLSTNHFSGAPVLSGTRVVGLISMSDILSFIVSAPEPEAADSTETVAEAWEERVSDEDEADEDVRSSMSDEIMDEWVHSSDGLIDDMSPDEKSLLDQHTVEEAMTRDVYSIKSGASVKSAASMMRQRGIHRVLVIDENRLAGIVTALDIARAVSERGIAGHGLSLDPCVPNPSPWIDLSCQEGV